MSHKFKKSELEKLLDSAMGKTLAEVDKKHLFERYANSNPYKVVKGVPGDIIEQSVLGLPKDSNQKADLLVDSVPTELKVTGVHKKVKGKSVEYVAKERLTITNVNYAGIEAEEFSKSHLWEKIENILLVYYQYGPEKAVSTEDYKKFKYLLYSNLEFNHDEYQIIKSDWEHVRSFFASERGKYIINRLKKEVLEESERRLLRLELSNSLNELMYLEVAPKYPRARLAIKNSYFKVKTKEIFTQKSSLIKIGGVSEYNDLVQKISDSIKPYVGRTLSDIAKEIQKKNSDLTSKKSIIPLSNLAFTNYLLGYILTGNYVRAGSVEELAKAGFIVKAFPIKPGGMKKEDAKLTPVVFSEFEDGSSFEESTLFNYLFGHRLLCGIFERHNGKDRGLDVFKGVKVVEFPDLLFEDLAKRIWNKMSQIYINNEYKSFESVNKKGQVIYNKNGWPRMDNNLPKGSEFDIFVKGTGSDSSKKSLILNGQRSYNLDYWMKGEVLVDLLESQKYI